MNKYIITKTKRKARKQNYTMRHKISGNLLKTISALNKPQKAG